MSSKGYCTQCGQHVELTDGSDKWYENGKPVEHKTPGGRKCGEHFSIDQAMWDRVIAAKKKQ